MKVLMTTETVGGGWTYCLELVKALAPYGVQFALAPTGPHISRLQAAQIRRLSNVELCPSHDIASVDPAAARQWLMELERHVQPDVVHLSVPPRGHMGLNAPVLAAVHTCLPAWWQAVMKQDLPASYDRYCSEVREGLQSADLVVAPTADAMEAIERHYGPLGPRRVIPDGRSRPAARECAALAKEPLVFSVGRLSDQAANVAMLDRIAPRLRWQICLAGEAQAAPAAAACHLHATRLGQLTSSAMGSWLARASIFALPARYEPFGFSAIDAAQAGCALVLGDIPSLREVWQDAAVFVPPDDDEGLTEAINKLIDDEPMRRAMAQRALDRSRLYCPGRMALRHLREYGHLMSLRDLYVPAGRQRSRTSVGVA